MFFFTYFTFLVNGVLWGCFCFYVFFCCREGRNRRYYNTVITGGATISLGSFVVKQMMAIIREKHSRETKTET